MHAGDVIDDRFDLREIAGHGGMGTVFRALDTTTGDAVAVKVLHGGQASLEERFHREVEVLAALVDDGIVRYVAHGVTSSGEMYLAMEWLDGITLQRYLDDGALEVAEALALASSLCAALAAAHEQGVVHRDLKPENVLLVGGDLRRAKIVDFGIAHLSHAARLTKTGSAIGTPGYMAPEQIRGADVDARTDLYALGCLLFECIANRPPFEGEVAASVLMKALLEDAPTLSSIGVHVSAGVEGAVRTLLCKEPSGRPRDAAAAAALLASPDGALSPTALQDAPASLGRAERHLLSLIVAGKPREDHGRTDSDDQLWTALRQTARSFLVDLEYLAGGLFAACVTGNEAPAEEAQRAVQCALAMRAAAADMPISVASGRQERNAALRVGEVIDRAVARLGAAPSDGICIDEATASLLRGRFTITQTDGQYSLSSSSAGPPLRTFLGKPTPLVGRGMELRQVESIHTWTCDEEAAGVALVIGPAGIGKSRLRHELLLRLASRRLDCHLLMARGDPLSMDMSFGIAAQLLQAWARLPTKASMGARRKSMWTRLCKLGLAEPSEVVADFLCELAGVRASEPGVEIRAARHEPQLMGDQIQSAWKRWLAALACDKPVVVVLEDLHWADRPSVALLDAALAAHEAGSLFLLALARPQVRDRFPGLWTEHSLTEIHLRGLSRKDCVALATSALGEPHGEQVERLVDHAEGNALFLEELIRCARDGIQTLPDSALAVFEGRLAAIDAESRHILRAASVFGRTFSAQGVAALVVAEHDIAAVRSSLAEMCRGELVSRDGVDMDTYRFRHAVLRDASYAMLTEDDAVIGHRLAGAWLEANNFADASVLAHHFGRGDDAARAAHWCRRAAEQSLEGNDLDGALVFCDRALALETDANAIVDIELLRCSAYVWRGKARSMLDSATRAASLSVEGSSPHIAAVAEMVTATRLLSEHERAVQLAEGLLRLTEHDGPQFALALARAAQQMFHIGPIEVGHGLTQRAARALRNPEIDPYVAGWIEIARGLSAACLGKPELYLSHSEAMVRHFERAGAVRRAANSRVHLAYAYISLGGFAEAEEVLAAALVPIAALGLSVSKAYVHNNLGLALAGLGKLDEALAAEHAAVDEPSTTSDLHLQGCSLRYMALIHLRRHEADEAEQAALRSVELSRKSPAMLSQALAVLALALLGRARASEALSHASRAVEIADEVGQMYEGQSLIRLAHARALHEAGDHEAACDAIRDARARLLEVAEHIEDPGWRRSFLERVSEHTETLSLASEWLGEPVDGDCR